MSTFIELYRLTKGSNVWTMTSSDTPIEYNSEYYRPVPIKRSSIDLKDEAAKSELNLTLPLDTEMAQSLMDEVPLREVLSVTVFLQISAATSTIWKGRLSSIKPSKKSIIINCESIFTSMRRTGLKQRYQRSCRYALYGRGCNVDAALHTTNMLVSAINGNEYTIPNAGLQVDQFYTGGMLQSAGGYRAYISSQIGASVKVNIPLPDVQALDNVDVISGCDHSRVTCESKFSNLANYGGFDWIPLKNILNGSTSVL